MKHNQQPVNLEQLLDQINRAAKHRKEVSLRAIVESVGRRSFAPLLLVAGLIAFSPLSGIPGVPTLVAMMVVLIAVQLLMNRNHFWLPKWLLNRNLSQPKLEKALNSMRKPARIIDRFLRPRLTMLTQNAGLYVVAILCVLIAATMPPMEIVPFAATTAGAALTAFALALIANDGLVGLGALILTSATAVFVLKSFVG